MLSKGAEQDPLVLALFQSLAQAWAVHRADRQMCGNRGDSRCDCLHGKFLVKPLGCDFRSSQCWGLPCASNSRRAVGPCCQPWVISAASPWSLYPQPGPALIPSGTETSRFFLSSGHYYTKSLHTITALGCITQNPFAHSTLLCHSCPMKQGYLACSNLKMSFGSLSQQK